MKQIVKMSITALIGGTLLASGCSKEEKKSENKSHDTAKKSDSASAKTAPAKEKSPEAKSPEAKTGDALPADTSFAAGMMKEYEICRALLASDKAVGVAACAAAIVEASKTSHKGAPEGAHEHIAALVTAAESLAKMPPDDIKAVRMAFGEVSKATVAMLSASPVAKKSYHIFECSMAEGYKRWAQPSKELENPYMGTKMSSCGEEIHDGQ